MRKQIDFIYNAGETKRFHTWPVLRTQNIAAHSWHVAMLLHVLYGQEEPGIRSVLLMAALCHDAAEWKFGDLPSPAKRALHERGFDDFRAKWNAMEEDFLATVGLDWGKFLTDEERRRLKLCDTFEGAIYCVRERAMGNSLIAEPFINFCRYAAALLEPQDQEAALADKPPTAHEREWDLYNYICEGWEQACGNR